MAKKIAINGFGRIGRTFLRSLMLDTKACDNIDIVAINVGPCFYENQDHFFKYDSLMGTFPGTVSFENNTLTINDHKIQIIAEQDPRKAPWGEKNIEWVVESSGCFNSKQEAAFHLEAGAQKVIITAPAKDEDITIIPGVNDNEYDKEKHSIISLGSCTANCFAPIIKVINDEFVIEKAMMNTVHSYTNSQVLLDVEHPDPRRARAAALNIIPTKTGAADVIFKIFPELQGKIHASAIRIPVPKVSLLEFYFVTQKKISRNSINNAFCTAANNELQSIIQYSEEPLVSSDYYNSQYSAIIDSFLTSTIGTMGKVVAWYDNEYGYCCRIKDFLLHN